MGLFDDLKRRGLWRGYTQHVLRLEPILVRMSERGMPVAPERHARVKRTLQLLVECADRKMQSRVPGEVRAVHPKRGYLKAPKDAVEGGSTTHAGEEAIWAMRDFPSDVEGVLERRWCKLLHWNPSGGEHGGLVRYMRFKDHPVPRDFKTDKITTQQEELKRLAAKTKDPFYAAVLDYRSASGLLDNHMVNWAPGADGRVHPTFYYDTATGQLGARRPNSMNAPKHKAGQGNLFRWMIVSAHC